MSCRSAVDAGAGYGLALGVRALDAVALADVVWNLPAPAGVLADRHALAAHAAQGKTLQQRRPLAGWTAATVRAVGQRVVAQMRLIGLEAIPCDVAGMRVRQQDRPLGRDVKIIVRVNRAMARLLYAIVRYLSTTTA